MSVRRATVALCCPIPSALSPHAEPTQQWLDGWLDGLDPALDPVTRQRAQRAGFARYAARLFPETTPARLRGLSMVFTLFFLLDDDSDAAAVPDADTLRATLGRFLAPLNHDGSRAPDSTGLLPGLLADWWQHTRSAMPPSWRDRFVDAVTHHMQGVIGEARAKAAGRPPTVARYVRLRRATSAAYVAHVLAEYAGAAPLPDAVHGHPAVRAYSTAGNDLLSWFNDLVSLDRDAATAGGHNLVLALAQERGLSMPEAVDAAAAMWRNRMDGLAALRAAVPSFGPALDRSVRHYLAGVDRSVRGTIDWSLESVRYRVPPAVAPFLPDGTGRN